MFGVFSFFFPAGLTLYIFTNTSLTAVHHLWMKRSEENAAANPVAKVKDEIVDVESTEVVGASADAETPAQHDGNRPPKGNKSRKRGGQRKRGNKRKRSA
jgi:membrane protein insertase Oxa1/YidC/SpoIIIJ